MEIIKTKDPKEFERYANSCLETEHEGMVAHITETPCVWTGQLETLDREACAKHSLIVGTGQYLGGTIVNMPGDLSICLTTRGDSDFAPDAVSHMAAFLEEKGIQISHDENDVLAEGKKVISWARATTIKGWCQSVIHVSIGDMDLKLVREICTKPMLKEPGSLSKYGITAEMLWDEIGGLIE